MHPRRQGRVGHTPEIVAENVTHKGVLGNFPKVGGRKRLQDPEGVTVSLAHKGDPTK